MAATTDVALPPMDKISMIGIWVETVLYGVNCVVYGLSMFTFLRERKIPTLRWVLLVMSTILFLLCTVHVGASLQQLLEAFVYVPADVPDYSTTYWLNFTTTLRVLKNTMYDTLVLTQDLILIWRLYVVFMYDWRVVIFPIILEAACMGAAYAASELIGDPNVGLYGSIMPSLTMTAWVLSIVLNVSVTMAIAIRLWWLGRKVAFLTANRTNRHISSIYVIVESGAMFAATSIVTLALYISNNPASLTGLDIGSQMAALTPLLIVVRVGQTRGYYIPTEDSLKPLRDGIVSRAGIHAYGERRDSDSELRTFSLHSTPSSSLSFAHGAPSHV